MSAEPQRNALTDLIARFTADRDRLIAVVQDCETRVEELVARSRGQEPGTAGPAQSVPSAELENVRAAMRELHDEIQILRTREPNTAVHSAVGALATETAQAKEAIEVLRSEWTRTRADFDRTATDLRTTVAETQSAVSRLETQPSGDPEAVWQRVEQALAPLSETTRALGARVAEVERGLRALASSAAAQPAAAPAGTAEVVSSDAVAELRAAMVSVDRRVDERAEELWRRVEQLVGPIRAETGAAAARAKDADVATREQLASAAGRITALAATVERLEKGTQERREASAQITALDAKLERVLGEHWQRLEGVATEAGRSGRVLVALSDRVARLEVIVALPQQSVLSSLYGEVRNAIRSQTGALTGRLPWDLWAWLPKPAALFRLVSRGFNG